MFKGFGGGKPSAEKTLQDQVASSSNNNTNGKDSSGGKSLHGFDPTSFERAAKAAKELDKSKNASRAVEIVKAEEITKQRQADTQRAQFKAMEQVCVIVITITAIITTILTSILLLLSLPLKQELAIRRIQEEAQSQEKLNENKTMHEKARAEYSDRLERSRMTDQINAQRQMREEEVSVVVLVLVLLLLL